MRLNFSNCFLKQIRIKTLVIHIGAPKCGSSSIQNFFVSHPRCSKSKTEFHLLSLEELDALKNSNQEKINQFEEVLNTLLKENSTIIISHEALFAQQMQSKTFLKLQKIKLSKQLLLITFETKEKLSNLPIISGSLEIRK